MVTGMKLHALLYPAWAILFVPSAAWLILLRIFLTGGLVLALALRHYDIPNKAQIWKRSILRVWLFAFLAHCLGAMLAFGLYAFLMPVGFPWEQLTMLPGAAFAGMMLYLFYSCGSFRRCELTQEQVHKLSLALALFTAPYTMLLPTAPF